MDGFIIRHFRQPSSPFGADWLPFARALGEVVPVTTAAARAARPATLSLLETARFVSSRAGEAGWWRGAGALAAT